MYQYDSNNILVDYKQYIVNLSATILNDEPSYELEYSAKSAYGLPDLSPKSWANLVQRFQTDDNLFQKWYYYYHKSFDPTDHCDSKCKGVCKYIIHFFIYLCLFLLICYFFNFIN